MFCNYFVRMESSKTARCFYAMVVKIKNPDRVAMNKYYCAGKTGSDFFEKAREKIKNTRH